MDGKFRILIADDSATMVKLVQMVLTREGHEVLVATDGLQAINMAYNDRPDLIISDVTMPGMNGYQVCRLLREDPDTQTMPFILLTAKDQKADKFWGIKTGADDFITKPFNPDDLAKRVKDLLDANAQQIEAARKRKPSSKPKTNEEIISRVNDLLDKKLYESTLLNEVASLTTSMENYHEIIVKVMTIVGKVIDYQTACLLLTGEDRDEIFHFPVKQVTRPFLEASAAAMVEAAGQYMGRDLSGHRRDTMIFNEANVFPAGTEGVSEIPADMIHVPLKIRNNVAGALMVAEGRAEAFVESHRQFLSLIVNQAAAVIDNARLYTELKSLSEVRERNLQIINQVGQLASSMTDMRNLMDLIVDFAIRVTNAEAGSLILYDRESNDLYFEAAAGPNTKGLKGQRLEMGQGIAGYAAETMEPLIIKDAQHDERFNKSFDQKTGFVTKSILCIPLKTKGEPLGVLEVINKLDDTYFSDADLDLLLTLGAQISAAIDNANMYESMKSLFLSTVQSLSSAIDAKNKYTNDHSRRVTIYSLAISQELGCTVEVCNNIRLSGLLHDIGKIGVAESILDKTSRLTDDEFKEIKRHPLIGAKIMEPIKPLQMIIPGMRYHHERYDGRGYPDGLKGKEIPLAGRIIAVADTFDAMTSDRSYRKGLSPEIALEEIRNCSGTQFDPVIVEAFLSAYAAGRIRLLK